MGIRFGFVSTYPPTRCGIATFSQSLMAAIEKVDLHKTSVVRLLDSTNGDDIATEAAQIVTTVTAGDAESMSRAVDAINSVDIAVIQHEFGIYGGPDGNEILNLFRRLRVPSIVVLHTVPTVPTWHQRVVLTEVCRRASAVVTMSTAARDRIINRYFVQPSKVSIIPHGAHETSKFRRKGTSLPPSILTWGLIGPGKGIEWAIEAMDRLRDLEPAPRYVVAGRTHPKVLKREGEAYRDRLKRRIDELGLNETVELRADYLSSSELADLLSSASLVLLPYDSTEQVTSGVLIEAVTAQRPVVATRFPHAVELVNQGVGLVVPHSDPQAIAEAVRKILCNPHLAEEMSMRAGAIASKLLWSSVAERYVQLARQLLRARAVA